MKAIFLICLSCTLTVLQCYSQKITPGDYESYVHYEGSPATGTVTVTTSGFGKTKALSSADAISNAFYTLLFRGIPGSQYELPMIANESQKKNDPVVKALLEKEYSTFITENTLQSEEAKKKRKDGAKGTVTVYKITINCDGVRRHLENKGVIRKFGI